MGNTDTKTRILDAAEYLFARHGYDATSLRQITGRAKVNLAAVNYHFGSKKELVKAVIARRLLPLNKLREERLDEVERALASGGKVGSREILRAFIEPTVHFRASGRGPEDFIVLVGRILAEPDQTAREIFIEMVRPLFLRLSEEIRHPLFLPYRYLFI